VGTQGGDLVCSAPPTTDSLGLVGRDYFQRALQTRAFAVGDYRSSAASDRATLDFGYPILGETGDTEAVVFASLDLVWLNQLAAEAQLPEGSTLIVVDRNGTILVHYPDPQTWVGQSVPEAPIIEVILAQRGEGTVESEGLDGVVRLYAFTPLSGMAGGEEVYVGIGIPTAVAFSDANYMLARSLGGLGLVTALALLATWVGGDLLIMRGVSMLVSAAQQLSAGDLSRITRLPDGRGELGQIAHALEHMAGSLEQRRAERDRAEEALRESQRALSTLMSNLPGMAYRCGNDRDWTMEFASDGCFDLTGYYPSELVGNQKISYGQLIHPDDRETVWNEVQVAIRERRPFQLTYRIVTAAGEEKWGEAQGRGVFSPEGDLLGLEGYVSDVTERVLAQQTLERRVANRTRELSALYEVMTVTSASLDLEAVLEKALDPVLAAMGSDVGAIHLLDESGKMLRLAVQQGIPQDLVTRVESIPVDGGLAGRVVERGEPLVIPDIAAGLRPLLAIPAGNNQSYVGVPVRVKGKVLGTLSVIGEPGRQFKPGEVTLLASIADEIGVAVENARLYRQAEQLAVMRERERLARELHDSVTQSLYSLTLLSEAGCQLAEADSLENVGDYLRRLGQISQQALKEMRLLVYELRPLVLQREGLVGALQLRLDAVEKRAGLDARLMVEGEVELQARVEEELYRIAQEALNNILKHATATAVTVCIHSEGSQVVLEVTDDGKGFDVGGTSGRGGIGLASMRERAEKIQGSLTVLSTPGEGTTIRISVEVPDD
jgi:PAS domain S-box-containing protein